MRGLLAAAAAAAALTMLVPGAHAGGPSLQIGAAEDDVKAPSLVETKAKLDLLKLAGLDAVRVTSIWDPLNPDPPPSEITVLNWLTEAAKLDGIEVYLSVYNFGSKTTPLTAGGAGELRAARRRARELGARPPELHHRQRAEPEPLLAAAVQLGRHRRRRAGVPGAPRPHVPGAEGGRPDDQGVRRRARPARHRPGGHAARHALAHRLPRRPGCRVPEERPDEPGDGRARDPPVPDRLERSAGEVDEPGQRVHRDRRLRQARDDARQGVRRNRPAGLDAADPLRRVRHRDPDPRREGRPVHGHRAGDDEGDHRGDPGQGLPRRRCRWRSATRT